MNKKTILIAFVCLTALAGFYVQNSTNTQTTLNPQLAEIQPELRSPIKKQHMPKSPAGIQHASTFISEQTVSEDTVKQLWRTASTSEEEIQSLPEEVLVEQIQVPPHAFDNLVEGQKVTLFIPQEGYEHVGTVEQSFSQFSGQVAVSSGSIEGGDQFSSFTITKGAQTTYVMVATNEGIYQVEIDNKTGHGTVIDDKELDHFRQEEDTVMPPPDGLS